jgi:hypothetical protein
VGVASFGATTFTCQASACAYLLKLNPDGSLAWLRHDSGTRVSWAHGVAALPDGSVWMVGHFTNAATFDGMTVTSRGASDIFVARYDAAGAIQWLTSAGGANAGESFGDSGNTISVTSDGTAYIAGELAGDQVRFDGISVNGSAGLDIFVAKLSPSGTFAWVAPIAGPNQDLAGGLAPTSSGLVVTGSFIGSTYVGDHGPFLSKALTGDTGSNGLIAKFDSADGGTLWAYPFSAAGGARGIDVAAAPDGAASVGGQFAGTTLFAGAGNTSMTVTPAGGGPDAFVARYSTNGELRSVWHGGGAGYDWVSRVVVNSSGGGYLAGGFSAPATFGSIALTSGTTFLLAFSSAGIFSAPRTLPVAPAATISLGVRGADFLADGTAAVTGGFSSSVMIGSMTLTSAGGSDAYVVRVAP